MTCSALPVSSIKPQNVLHEKRLPSQRKLPLVSDTMISVIMARDLEKWLDVY
jgi:hypothetical protein